MSAFVCGSKTINRIAGGLFHAKEQGGYNRSFAKPSSELLELMGESIADFGKTLYLMNVNAVEQRYPDCIGKPDNLPGECDENGHHSPYKYNLSRPDRIQFYKSLQCFLYQCTEGDVDELPLYKQLDFYLNDLARHIIVGSKEYEKADWG